MNSPNAIITCATGYGKKELNLFLSSIKYHCPNVRLFLITYKKDRKEIQQLAKEFSFIEPFYIKKRIRKGAKLARPIAFLLRPLGKNSLSKPWVEPIGRAFLPIVVDRFFIALQIVKQNKKNLSAVLVTDSRDVVFQGNPFEALESNLEVSISGIEGRTIGKCPFNSSWIEMIYGKKVLEKMIDHRIVCAGVTIGSVEAVENYLQAMCQEFWDYLPKVYSTTAYDQGIHNYLNYSNKYKHQDTDNDQGIIATLGYCDKDSIVIDRTKNLLRVYDKYPAIVHQYDRYSELDAFFREQYLYSSKISPTRI